MSNLFYVYNIYLCVEKVLCNDKSGNQTLMDTQPNQQSPSQAGKKIYSVTRVCIRSLNEVKSQVNKYAGNKKLKASGSLKDSRF